MLHGVVTVFRGREGAYGELRYGDADTFMSDVVFGTDLGSQGAACHLMMELVE